MKNKLLKILLFVSLGGVLLLGGAYAGYRGYKSIRQARLVKEAREYLEKQDLRKAQLCLQRAVRYNNRDVETCRLMAQLAEASGSSAAVIWRGRVVEFGPGALDDRLALAKTALNFRDYAAATNALGAVDESEKKSAAYHDVAGEVAAAANQLAEAETHFREATRLDPQNSFLKLSLAMAQIRQTNSADLTEARASLKTIAVNPTNSALRSQALRVLTLDALRGKQTEIARDLSERLLQETNSVFRDRLLRLEVLRETKSDQFKPTVAAFQKEAGTNLLAIKDLGLWEVAALGPSPTLAWLRTLPADTQRHLPTALLIADCLALSKDWKGLQAAIDQQNWGEIEFLRHAYKARALRGQDLTGAAKGEWELALKASNNQVGSLTMLMRYAAQQQWANEVEEILWTIVRRYPDERWAIRELSQTLYLAGRTRPLLTLYTQEHQRAPQDLSVKNNLAVTALLLEAYELRPHDLALDIYQKAPTNAAFASTYAYSLHLQKKDAEALKVMQKLPPKALEHPSIAGYYGVILSANGDRSKARPYLDWAYKSPMLPEEKKLFEGAKAAK